MAVKLINTVKQGLLKSLGDLELTIMEVLWNSSTPLSAREVTNTVKEDKGLSFNTISTVLNRLTEKNVVEKKAEGKRYSFSPIISKKEYSQNILQVGIKSLLGDPELLSTAGISEGMDNENIDQETIALLKDFIKKYDVSK